MNTGRGKNTIPHPLRKTGKKAALKAQRRAEAEARQRYFDSLSDDEKKIHLKANRERYEARKVQS